MREFGGYIEIEHYKGNEYHTECLALNNGRNCLRLPEISDPYETDTKNNAAVFAMPGD